MFHYTVETNHSVDETVAMLEDVLKKEKFGVLWDLNLQETLENKGFDFDRNYRVLEVCNPEAAYEVLTQNHMVGYFLPCKIVVYEDQGKTKVGMPKPTELIGLTGDNTLKEIAQDVETRLTSCMDQVVKG